MTKTTNYQLPKWEKTDRIQMKDFNDMTATLDAALGAIGKFETIAETTFESDTPTYTFDLTGFDWAKWQFVGVSVQAQGDKGSFLATFMGVSSPNGDNYVRLAHVSPNPFVAVSAPCHDAESTVKGFFIGSGQCGPVFGVGPFSQITSLSVGGSGVTYPVGTKVTLWGVK